MVPISLKELSFDLSHLNTGDSLVHSVEIGLANRKRQKLLKIDEPDEIEPEGVTVPIVPAEPNPESNVDVDIVPDSDPVEIVGDMDATIPYGKVPADSNEWMESEEIHIGNLYQLPSTTRVGRRTRQPKYLQDYVQNIFRIMLNDFIG